IRGPAMRLQMHQDFAINLIKRKSMHGTFSGDSICTMFMRSLTTKRWYLQLICLLIFRGLTLRRDSHRQCANF
ncbi:MAG TPA: hypothetical protein VFF42_04105, partial [Candidatus Eremiobacteraceae bacterium]|nr:hypothetical protein [Candidatus Eremiobacteraceae bacterium]